MTPLVVLLLYQLSQGLPHPPSPSPEVEKHISGEGGAYYPTNRSRPFTSTWSHTQRAPATGFERAG